jgi:hypothetical protein
VENSDLGLLKILLITSATIKKMIPPQMSHQLLIVLFKLFKVISKTLRYYPEELACTKKVKLMKKIGLILVKISKIEGKTNKKNKTLF